MRANLSATIFLTSILSISFTLITITVRADTVVRWKKTVVDSKFRAEGVAVVDVNKDGKADILVGDFWYEAPAWTAHEIRKPLELGDGSNSFSEAFLCFADDFNGDQWPDLLVIGFPGAAAKWYENPQNKTGHWKEHEAWPSANNETPQFADLFGDGHKVLVMASQAEGQMAWFSPPPNGQGRWTMHPISEVSTPENTTPGTNRYSHGLGTGDMNGDGRLDVLTNQGWWEQPEKARERIESWLWHPVNLGPDCADMHVADMNGDGRPDVLASSAHDKGVWWYEQRPNGKFLRHTIATEFSQSHALRIVDINGDGHQDLVTGKRRWAHGPTGDIEPNAPAMLFWFERKPGATEFIAHQIDNDSGIGTQFSISDINADGLPDIVVANKEGVHLFEQVRP